MMNRRHGAYVVKTRPAWAFVPHPGVRGLYVRTHVSVAFNPCPMCGSPTGVPCVSKAMKGLKGEYVVEAHPQRSRGGSSPRLDPKSAVAAFEVELSGSPS